MFVRYQHVRNGTIGMSGLAVVAMVAYATCSSGDYGPSQSNSNASATAAAANKSASTTASPVTQKLSSEVQGLYDQAMRIAKGKATRKKSEDALGGKARWKVNLYDDDGDGAWDHAKLDRDRNGTWDEMWTRKKGQWSKDKGRWVWALDAWIKPGSAGKGVRKTMPQTRGKGAWAPDAAAPGRRSYVRAMHLANSRAIGRKNQDALGNTSNWKLDLHDADGDGIYERARLDYERDGKWDEIWNRKKGRWEKSGGALVWSGKAWIKADMARNLKIAVPKVQAPDPKLKSDKRLATAKPRGDSVETATLVRLLLKDKAGAAEYKDAMGYKSTWQVNLYDEDNDGRWDHAKVDKGRDGTWDEKWSRSGERVNRKDLHTGKEWVFKGGKWEAD